MATWRSLALLGGAIAGPPGLAAQISPPPPQVFRTQVHAVSPRLQALNPIFLGHLPDPLSDPLRNPARVAESSAVALVADGGVGGWALHAAGRRETLGWRMLVLAGPERRTEWPEPVMYPVALPPLPEPNTVAAPVIATPATALEARLALSTPLGGGGRVGATGILATQPSEGVLVADTGAAGRRSLKGNGWGAEVGWSRGRPHESGAADLALGMSDGTVYFKNDDPYGYYGGAVATRNRHRELWARLALAAAGGRASVVIAARRESEGAGYLMRNEVAPSSNLVTTTAALEASAARRWMSDGWSAGVVAALGYQNVELEVSVPAGAGGGGLPEADRWSAAAGAAGEVSVARGIWARGSVVARLSRIRWPDLLGGTIEGSEIAYQALTDVRLGLGCAIPGSPLTFDAYLAELAEPRHWVVSAAYRF